MDISERPRAERDRRHPDTDTASDQGVEVRQRSSRDSQLVTRSGQRASLIDTSSNSPQQPSNMPSNMSSNMPSNMPSNMSSNMSSNMPSSMSSNMSPITDLQQNI